MIKQCHYNIQKIALAIIICFVKFGAIVAQKRQIYNIPYTRYIYCQLFCLNTKMEHSFQSLYGIYNIDR
jgi:hypothetical protein